MKRKFYRLLPLLFVSVFASASIMAQPGWHRTNSDRGNDDYKNRGYDNHRYDENDRYDDRYDKQGRSYENNNRDYRKNEQDGYYASGRYIIRHRPKEPRMDIPRRPSPYHVWMDGDWIYSRGQYYYQPGHWVMPVRGMRYVQGHWERADHGWYWEPGFWTRQNRW